MKARRRVSEGEEDRETLAAIDEGLRDVKEGRVVSEKKVRQLVRKWTSVPKKDRRRPRSNSRSKK